MVRVDLAPGLDEQRRVFFAGTPGAELTRLFQRTFWDPYTAAGLDTLRQGSFLTQGGQDLVKGGGLRYASPGALMDWPIRLF